MDNLTNNPANPTLIKVLNLSKHFDVSAPWLTRVIEKKPKEILKAVKEVSFTLEKGKTLALVGESGCGKSTLARVVAGLYQPSHGEVRYRDQNLHQTLKSQEGHALRQKLQMIFQDPFASLNPRWTVHKIVAEPIVQHRLLSNLSEIKQRIEELLVLVGLSATDAPKFPHQFSGGQRQRISIARALASHAELLICDEPTSALDVSVQAQVLNLMKDLQQQNALSYLFISHNLSVVRNVSDEVGVMYLGSLVELASCASVFTNPQHPYTKMLISAIPSLKKSHKQEVYGEVPNPIKPPSGCTFHPRCQYATDICKQESPNLRQFQGIQIACHHVN
ncbi:MAG: ATP-binding cassette domain-containing protein [Gammaproteobacteria bacterium]|nr:ATP-binding cassette domain-containing protein [Gammaproteobacteria bacterium]